MIYNAVLRANRVVIDTLKPGVCYVAMHKLANRIVLEDLVKAGILKGDVDEMMKVILKQNLLLRYVMLLFIVLHHWLNHRVIFY